LMMSTNNILSPASGEPIVVPTQDVVLGLYWMTRERVGTSGEGMIFADVAEVERAYRNGMVELQARIKVRLSDCVIDNDGERDHRYRLMETTVGRALLSQILPAGLPFEMINRDLTKKSVGAVLNACYRRVGLKETVIFADQLMYTG
ncbi:MAG TPA: DNA-directed RNA polymerase subunit beta', partial [Gammaproteobacteria bacterium]|nr:DNA-directed RNA polymerase subunit beta' [Gammaproteobacteria bacterium]